MTALFPRFIEGFGAFFRGFSLLVKTPRLWGYALTPFVIGFLFLIGGFVWAVGNMSAVVHLLVNKIDIFSGLSENIAYWIALILAWPAFLFALFYTVFLLSRLIASPFHALLAERVLITTGALRDQPFRLAHWLRLSLRMLLVSLVRTILFGVIGIILFFLSLIPAVNIVAAFGFLLIIAFDCADYSFEAMQMSLRDRLVFFRANFWYFCGFAASLGLVFFVPGFNFFLFPVAVTGAGELVSRLRSPARG